MAHLASRGLSPEHVRAIPAAAGGPKGLILGRLDRFIFGDWLSQSGQPIDLVGASIGAWRMATACTDAAVQQFAQLERDYIAQDYEVEPGRKRPTAAHISERFGVNLNAFFASHVPALLDHPRFRLHIITSRGKGILSRETPMRAGVGFAAAFASNAVGRRHMGRMLERVVFSRPGAHLPFAPDRYPTRQVALSEANFAPALQASCAIPFALKSVHNISGAPPGAYWDGGLTDYHLHLDWRQSATDFIAINPLNTLANIENSAKKTSVVLYPHFQQAVVPGWLDKSWKKRHASTPMLDDMVVLAPRPEWVATLPDAKLPDRSDFTRTDLAARVKTWTQGANASQQLADEFAQWLRHPNLQEVLPL